MKPNIKDLLEHHYAREDFRNASGRTPQCVPLRVIADVPSLRMRLSAEQFAHVAGCAGCLHSLSLSMRFECPAKDFLSEYGGAQSPIAMALREHIETRNCVRCRNSFAEELPAALSALPDFGTTKSTIDTSTLAAPPQHRFFRRLWQSSRPRGFTAFALSGVIAAAVLIGLWLGFDHRWLKSDHPPLASARGPAHPPANPARPDRPEGPDLGEKQIATLALALSPTTMSGDSGTAPRLLIPARGIDRIRLNMDFAPNAKFSAYRVILSPIDGTPVLQRDFPGALGKQGKISLDVPAPSLRGGDYSAIVQGRSGSAPWANVESYFFRVVIKDPLL